MKKRKIDIKKLYMNKVYRMDLSQYIVNDLLDIPKDIVLSIDHQQLAIQIAQLQLPFPTREMLQGDLKFNLFSNLMEYKPIISKSDENYDNIKWLTTTHYKTNKYLGKSLTFLSNDDDYLKIDQLTDFFTENQRMNAYRIDTKISPLKYWNDNMIDLVLKTIKRHGVVNSQLLRDELWQSRLEANNYKLTAASSIYWQFNAKNILDISAGWGDRLTAAIAQYAERYLAYDPNLDLKYGHDEIIETFTINRTTSRNINKYEVRYQPFETAEIGNELFDLIFTSPPYFNLEIYSKIAGQSLDNYPKFDDWVVKFLFKSLAKAWNHLKTEGNMVLHISDYHTYNYCEATVLFVLGWCENASFDGVIGSKGHSGKVRPNWVFHKHSRSNAKEIAKARHNLQIHYPYLFFIINSIDDDAFKSSMKKLENANILEITTNSPKVKYQERDWNAKKEIVHWGQRKLLFTEIMFLTMYGDLSNLVIYAGAAPGTHINYLTKLFPNHHFILVDPRDFDESLKSNSKITIRTEYFDEKMAKEYNEKNVLFISDIRTADWKSMSPEQNEQYILLDNKLQMDCINIMKPIYSMIKFRCVYPHIIKTPTTCFKGRIYLQAWAPPSSTETRLLIDGSNLQIVNYDNILYEEQLSYHNTVARFKDYSQPIKGEGLDKKYDSTAEVYILFKFLEKFPQYLNGRRYYDVIVNMSYDISRAIGNKRTLETKNKAPENRKQGEDTFDHSKFHKEREQQ